MQWTSGKNGGFSAAPASRLSSPVTEGAYGPEFINVTDQLNDPESLLNFIRRLTQTYRHCPELGWGTFTVLEQPHACVLAHRCTWDDGSLVALHNFSAGAVTVPLTVDDVVPGTVLTDLLQEGSTELTDKGTCEVTLDGYGYRWLRVSSPGSRRLL